MFIKGPDVDEDELQYMEIKLYEHFIFVKAYNISFKIDALLILTVSSREELVITVLLLNFRVL